jgi:hypothetical protein
MSINAGGIELIASQGGVPNQKKLLFVRLSKLNYWQ